MSIFEVLMLVCFGSAWPLSIMKMLKSKSSAGKSQLFLWVLAFGYVCGVLHKVYFSFDYVIILYALNLCLILFDIYLVNHYRKKS